MILRGVRSWPRLSGLGIGLGLWAWVAWLWATPMALPGPSAVAVTLVEEAPLLLSGAWRSGLRVLSGWLVAAMIGVPLGLGMASSPTLDRELARLLVLLRPLPPFVWLPLVLLWFGVGEVGAVVISALGAFPVVLSHAREGVSATPLSWVQAAENLGATRWGVFWRVRLPAALPLTRSGLRRAWSVAWMSLVAAELVGTDGGLGQILMDARNLARPELGLAAMVTLGVVAAASGRLLEGRAG